MAPRNTRIRADQDAAATGKKAARARADAHFTKGKGKKAKAGDEKLDGAKSALKATVLDLQLPERRDYASHLASISACKEKVATATALLRNEKKRCKEAGIDPKEIEDAIYWKDKDPQEFNRWLAGTMRACEAAGVKTPQISFLDESGLSSIDRAKNDGRAAGLAGQRFAMNPHDPNSDIGRAWEDARAAGNIELAGKSFGGNGEAPKADAAPQKPLFADDDSDDADAADEEGGEPWPDDEQIAAAKAEGRELAEATH